MTLRFYEVMHYPVPLVSGVFSYWFQRDDKETKSDFSSAFSWSKKSEKFDEFLLFIQKWNWLYRNFPFVKQIFLANSITFNALKPTSDIDLFVVTQKGRIWATRLFMSVVMFCFHIKRTQKSEYKKFCISFFVDEEHLNLEKLLLDQRDVYLPYWISHLVPLYQEQRNQLFFEQNAWILRFLPHFPKKQAIFLWNQIISWRWSIKKIIEFLLYGKIWDVFEQWIEKLWLPRMKRLQKKNPELHQGVVIADGILKFHHDKREKYSKLFFS